VAKAVAMAPSVSLYAFSSVASSVAFELVCILAIHNAHPRRHTPAISGCGVGALIPLRFTRYPAVTAATRTHRFQQSFGRSKFSRQACIRSS
jgi:hypothetical protein